MEIGSIFVGTILVRRLHTLKAATATSISPDERPPILRSGEHGCNQVSLMPDPSTAPIELVAGRVTS